MSISYYQDIDQSLNHNYVVNVDSIKQSIKNILMTRKGTRLFNSEFGSNIHKYLFDIMDDVTSFNLLNEIVSAVERWEPRVRINFAQSRCIPDYTNRIYWVTLVFTLIINPTEIHEMELGISPK